MITWKCRVLSVVGRVSLRGPLARMLVLVVVATLLLVFASCDMLMEETGDGSGGGDDGGSQALETDDFESNNSRTEAVQIERETDVYATVAPVDDVDWYMVHSANSNVWDWVSFDVKNVDETIEIEMAVYDQDGNEVFTANPGTAGANLSETMSTLGGSFYVRIASTFSGDTGAYTLNVRNLDMNDQYAPNDTRPNAHDLGTLPVSGIDGMIVSSSEEDWFQFTTSNDGVWDYVQLEATNVADTMEIFMAVYNADGNEVFTAHPGTAGANLSHMLVTSGGTYTVKLTSNFGGDWGNYTLAVQNQDANDSYEPNDERSSAHALGALPFTILGTVIWSPPDEDWYSFTAVSGNTMTVEVSGVGQDLEPVMRLEDQAGNSYTYTGSTGAGFTVTTDDMSTISPVDGETYYIRMIGNFSGDHGDYTLAVSQ